MNYKVVTIREAEDADIVALAELMNELGYGTTEGEMKTRLQNIQNHNDYQTFIAITDKQVAGMVGLSKNYSYEQNGMYVRILALVTSNKFRQKGIGTRLMETAENWAREIGAETILLNCGNREERIVAQKFYQKIGYHIKSSGFKKKL